jgi:hypothetical protein
VLRLNLGIAPTTVPNQFRGANAQANGRGLGATGCFVPNANGALPKNLQVASNPNCDPAGFPNGRRPGDDTVDIALRVVMGYLLTSGGNPNAPAGDVPLGDGVAQVPTGNQFSDEFPYLYYPNPGTGL